MIKKILIILGIIFFNTIAIAKQKTPNWIYVGQNDKGSRIYVDVNNISNKSKNIKQYWTKINMEKPTQLSITNYYSIKAFMDVKCDESTVLTNFLKFYQHHDNRGEASPNYGNPNRWDMIIPGSIESDMVFKYVCK